MYFTINLTQAKGSLSVNCFTYFTVIQTKTYIFHVSTLPKSICDKTTAKKRWSLPKTMFLGVETTFRHTFPFSNLQCLPPDDPRVLCANMGIRLLATHSFFTYLLACKVLRKTQNYLVISFVSCCRFRYRIIIGQQKCDPHGKTLVAVRPRSTGAEIS